MDHISNEELREVPAELTVKPVLIEYNDDTISNITDIMNSPLDVQKEEAAILYNYLYQKRKKEILEKGIISDHTRRIMENYHTLLDNIHRAMYGQKSVNLNLNGEMTPGHISAFIEKHSRRKK